MAYRRNKDTAKRVLVIGLGRFGGSLAMRMMEHGWEVLAVDNHPRRVQAFTDSLTHAAVGDASDEEVLHQLGASQFARAVVAIGSHVEVSILATSYLVDAQVDTIWAKAASRRHGRILEQIGAHHVVLPEHDMGERVAHLVSGRMLDYVEIEDGFSLVKTGVPRKLTGRPLGDTGVRQEYGITVVSVKQPGQPFTYATQDTVLNEGDRIVVAGRSEDLERFAEAR